MKKWDHYNFFLIKRLSEITTYYQRNREVMLNKVKECYKSNKKVLREMAKNKYRELSVEQKYIEREYGRKRYKNMSEENKQRIINSFISNIVISMIYHFYC